MRTVNDIHDYKRQHFRLPQALVYNRWTANNSSPGAAISGATQILLGEALISAVTLSAQVTGD